MERVPGPPDGVKSPPVFVDGFGARYLTYDDGAAGDGEPVEILSFSQAIVDSPEFAAALGTHVARLASARHTLFARVRRLDRPAPDALHLVSDHVPGWRLAHVLDVMEREKLSLDISAVLSLLRQLVPAVALFSRNQRELAMGSLGPERLILTPQGRLVLAEYLLGPALETLSDTRDRLWRTYRVAIPQGASDKRVTPRADVLGIGIVVLSLLHGRRLQDEEFSPSSLEKLLENAAETSANNVRPLSPGLSTWLARVLQTDKRTSFQTPKEAHVAFEEVLATERGYMTTPALLDAFLANFATIAGAPPEPGARPRQDDTPPADDGARPRHDDTAAADDGARPRQATSDALPVAEELIAQAVISQPAEPEPAIAEAAIPEPSASIESEAAVEEPAPEWVPPPAVAGNEEPTAVDFAPEAEAVAPPIVTTPTVAEPVHARAADDDGLRVRVTDESRGWMTKALAGFALVAVLQFGALVWLWNQRSEMLASDGELVVRSMPAAVKVQLDDGSATRELGATPVSVKLAPGNYTLKAYGPSGQPRIIPVQIRAGVQTVQYLELQTGR